MQLELCENSPSCELLNHEAMGLYAGQHNPQSYVSAKTGNG